MYATENNKNITILHTNGDSDSTSASRKQKYGSIKNVLCPEAVKLYNQYMNGVDHEYQLRCYPGTRPSKQYPLACCNEKYTSVKQ